VRADGAAILRELAQGGFVPPTRLAELDAAERSATLERLLDDAVGRRWLRALPSIDAQLAACLLAHEADFQATRRDQTLDALVRTAPLDALVAHAVAIAGSSAADAFWRRLTRQPDTLIDVATAIASGVDSHAGETTLYLLVADPLDPSRLGEHARRAVAAAGLRAPDARVRGLAAEFLATHAPAQLLADFATLIEDEHEQVRGIAWNAAFTLAPRDASERAETLIADEGASIAVRRSALAALGANAPTATLVELLAWAVQHPDAELAGDAADLLYAFHRHPAIAQAAQASPHARVRAIGDQLLDPLRGSPAAGGSRPGDPTRVADIFEELLRHAEERETP
jgi:hypothetical protein